MVRGREWTGFEAAALQEAMRKSIRDFAGLLGIETTTVSNWRTGLSSVTLRPRMQEILDTTLEQRTTPEDRKRFEQLVAEGEDAWRIRHAVTKRRTTRIEKTSQTVSAVVPVNATMALLADLDRARIVVDDTLTSCTVSYGRLDLFEERMNEHIQTYTTTAPSSVLGAVMPDLLEVQGIAAKRQPAAVQFRLSEISSVLSLLAADALMKLGQVERADHWYGTARLAADDTPNLQLRAQVRAQHAMLPYYYGRIERTIALAREAQALLPGLACDATALATAAEARALARLGDLESAERAVAKTQQLAESLDMGTNDEAFRFTEKRLLLYLSGTLTYMGQTTRATRIQTEALGLYRQNPDIVIDPALIHLDAAIGHANDGVFDDACQLATDVLSQLPTEHRTTIVTARAEDVIQAIPEARRQLPSVTQLRELMASESSGSTP